MGKESPKPAKEHHRSVSGTQPPSHGTASLQVIYGWDQHSLLILSIILTGTFPLAITSGIAIGAIAWNWDAISHWWAALIGLGAGVVGAGLEGLLLILLTRPFARRRLAPCARSLFPPSSELARMAAEKSG